MDDDSLCITFKSVEFAVNCIILNFVTFGTENKIEVKLVQVEQYKT